MMSDQAKGLFHKAIPLSGTSFIKAWPFAPTTELTEKLALALGWNGKNGERGILEVLENVSAFDLVEAESKLLTNEDIFAKHICFPFTPVVEPYVNERTFLPKDPVLLGREAWSKDINCMLGGTSLEGGMMLLWMKDAKFEEILRDPAGLTLARELGLDVTKPSDKQKALKYGEKLKKFYFGEGSITSDMKHQYLLVNNDKNYDFNLICNYKIPFYSMRAISIFGMVFIAQPYHESTQLAKEKLFCIALMSAQA